MTTFERQQLYQWLQMSYKYLPDISIEERVSSAQEYFKDVNPTEIYDYIMVIYK